MDDADKQQYLQAVRDAKAIMEELSAARERARLSRADAIKAADDAGVPREEIAEAAGVGWPISRSRWHQLRSGKLH